MEMEAPSATKQQAVHWSHQVPTGGRSSPAGEKEYSRDGKEDERDEEEEDGEEEGEGEENGDVSAPRQAQAISWTVEECQSLVDASIIHGSSKKGMEKIVNDALFANSFSGRSALALFKKMKMMKEYYKTHGFYKHQFLERDEDPVSLKNPQCLSAVTRILNASKRQASKQENGPPPPPSSTQPLTAPATGEISEKEPVRQDNEQKEEEEENKPANIDVRKLTREQLIQHNMMASRIFLETLKKKEGRSGTKNNNVDVAVAPPAQKSTAYTRYNDKNRSVTTNSVQTLSQARGNPSSSKPPAVNVSAVARTRTPVPDVTPPIVPSSIRIDVPKWDQSFVTPHFYENSHLNLKKGIDDEDRHQSCAPGGMTVDYSSNQATKKRGRPVDSLFSTGNSCRALYVAGISSADLLRSLTDVNVTNSATELEGLNARLAYDLKHERALLEWCFEESLPNRWRERWSEMQSRPPS